MAVPSRIPIVREEGYHTDQIGKSDDGRQFMAFAVASLPADGMAASDGWQKRKGARKGVGSR